MKMAKEQELERQTRRHKKAVKQRTSKSGGKRRKHGAATVDDDAEDDIPVMHVVSTTVDLPEVLMYSLSLDTSLMKDVVAWLSCSALVSINVVTLHRTRLTLGCVTVCGWVNHRGMYPATYVNLAFHPSRVG